MTPYGTPKKLFIFIFEKCFFYSDGAHKRLPDIDIQNPTMY